MPLPPTIGTGRALLSRSGRDVAEFLRQQLTMPDQTGKSVTIEYSTATKRYVWTPIRDRYWTRWTLNQLATSSMWTIDDAIVYDVVRAWSDRDASITYSSPWSQGASAGALNNTWSYTKVNGRYLEFTVTPAADGCIYLVYAAENSGGIVFVTIDGGTTLANELPLVSGNRELDTYAAAEAKNTRTRIASGLTVAPHTVRVTVQTGKKNASSSDYYCWFEGYGITAYDIDNAQIVLATDRKQVRQVGYSSSNSTEYAHSIKPGAATGYEWSGTNHLNEIYSAWTWTDAAGNDMSVSVGTPKKHAALIIVEQTGVTRHSTTGTTDHANILCRHTFSHAGLDIYHSHSWLTAGWCAQAFPGMWRLVEAAAQRAIVAGASSITDMSATNTGDGTRYINRAGRLIAAWNSAQPWVAWNYIPSLDTVNYWAAAPDGISLRDDATTTNKIYIQRIGGVDSMPNAAINIGDVWSGTIAYRISYIPAPETDIRWFL